MLDINAIARETIELAQTAAQRGTFGVGGILVTKSGERLANAVNKVSEYNQTLDTTAHVERQLIDWYFQKTDNNELECNEDDLVLITSAEPCMMCTGAILSTNIKTIFVAEEPLTGSGATRDFYTLPDTLRSKARNQIFRAPTSKKHMIATCLHNFIDRPLHPSLTKKAINSLLNSIHHVRHRISFPTTGSITDLRSHKDSSIPRLDFMENLVASPMAQPNGIISCSENIRARNHVFQSDQTSTTHLEIDNIALGLSDSVATSPLRISTLEVIRLFWQMTRSKKFTNLVENKNKSNFHLFSTEHLSDAQIVMALGAIGSFYEGPTISETPILIYGKNTNIQRASNILANFPPFYLADIGLTVTQGGS
jgi:tRNA(Arg) A34 adenosine deaminase TadA